MSFSEARNAMAAYNKTRQRQAELKLFELGRTLKARIDSCDTDYEQLMSYYDRWVVSVDFSKNRPVTNYNNGSTEFGRSFFDGSHYTNTFYHEFRHTMPQNNDLYGSATDYTRGTITGTASRLPIEQDADRWADRFSRGLCECD